MLIGVPKEIKPHEYRVGLTPGSARELIHHGHNVLVETNAGAKLGMTDEEYKNVGAAIAADASEIFEKAEMVVKVKEPQEVEWKKLRDGQILFTYLHLAAEPELAKGLKNANCVAIAYETITSDRDGLPLLAPMSEIAGRMSVHAGAHTLEIHQGGRGVLLGAAPGVAPAKVAILGGGVAGTNAARMALGLGADVSILDISARRLRELDQIFGPHLRTIFSSIENVEQYVFEADLVIGAVLVPGASAPKLVTREMLKEMKTGTVVVDIAIDQGGCFETSKPTTHDDPTYIVEDVVHYCVANMPGAVANSSTVALNNATLPFVTTLANKGYAKALLDDSHFRNGLNVMGGKITHGAVGAALGENAAEPLDLLEKAA
ncbi:MAG: alanine dehydrogenase [Hyphomicrobiales bacterium]|nr:alanine dehydrogenase [Hyphomicrobiales bacterium]MCY4053759.1 alanine dehydrogenase [Hyphomicrobiales bacterium]